MNIELNKIFETYYTIKGENSAKSMGSGDLEIYYEIGRASCRERV